MLQLNVFESYLATFYKNYVLTYSNGIVTINS